MSNSIPIQGKHRTWESLEGFLEFARAYGVKLGPTGYRYSTNGWLVAQVFRVKAATEEAKEELARFAGENGFLLGRVVKATKGKGARREYVAKDDEYTLTTPTKGFIHLTDRQQIEYRAESAALELELRYGVKA